MNQLLIKQAENLDYFEVNKFQDLINQSENLNTKKHIQYIKWRKFKEEELKCE